MPPYPKEGHRRFFRLSEALSHAPNRCHRSTGVQGNCISNKGIGRPRFKVQPAEQLLGEVSQIIGHNYSGLRLQSSCDYMRVVFVGETLASGEKLIKINDHRFLECSFHACSCARCTYGGVGDVLIGQDLSRWPSGSHQE
ncbi:conserved hypothetical protein (plasmid) [Sinorhizobium meliloti SM11]|uniref:Uncharacterized protein n=1 Tax=Sinorhizobium meliloti (strain SM11) TaxID=707241 RepID=F7XDF0_SINMM|nr:conserved hypothetical protein [Sinorhizobium meliloti SM11]